MAEALTMTPPAASNVERFSRGEPIVVEVGRIERELAALWQEASRAHPGDADGPSAVARAALWNLVIPARGGEALDRAKHMVAELASSIPARSILLFRDPAAPPGALQATIESNVVSKPGGSRVVFSEEITLAGPRGSEEHFGALVRSLQIPGLPTATVSIEAGNGEGLLVDELLPLSDRLIVDSGRCDGPGELAAVCRLASLTRAEVSDLGWLRLAGFRLLFAGLFDPPVGGQPLLSARRAFIEHRPHSMPSALLLGAWLGCQLNWNPIDAARVPQPGGDGHGTRLWFTAPGDRSQGTGGVIELDLRPSSGECGTSGIVAIQIQSGENNAAYGVRRTADNHAEIAVPIAPPKSVKLDSRGDAELCMAALGPSGRDPLLRRVLAYARRLGDLVAERGAAG
jgi:hypothetical protein